MKSKTIFSCNKCGAQTPKWAGRCTECGAWGTMGEDISDEQAPSLVGEVKTPHAKAAVAQLVTSHPLAKRSSTGFSDIDTVLGGGITQGSLILIGGEPGIGKSTLILQLAVEVAKQGEVLYASSEESAAQVGHRLARIGTQSPTLLFTESRSIEAITAEIRERHPLMCIVDSIQTAIAESATTSPGTSQHIRTSTALLMECAKSTGTSIIIIGHVTKEGALAGPKTLEHLVDTVLYLEGDRDGTTRLLRSVKNRFGATDEVAIFSLDEKGLHSITNPSLAFYHATQSPTAGVCAGSFLEGNRPIIAEVQVLATPTSFGYPTRKASGIALARLEMILAVLTGRTPIKTSSHDIYCSLIGGLHGKDPSLDASIALAVASSIKDIPLTQKTIILGEIALTGELRPVKLLEKRVHEAHKLGFEYIYAPKTEKLIPHTTAVGTLDELIAKTLRRA